MFYRIGIFAACGFIILGKACVSYTRDMFGSFDQGVYSPYESARKGHKEQKKNDESTVTASGDLNLTRYQMIMWSLKAAESYRPTWYPDGDYQAIGLGYNHLGDPNRKKAISWATRDGKVTYTEATEILSDYVEKLRESEKFQSFSKGRKLTEWQEVAVICHMYNCGSVSKYGVGACCGARKGCRRGLDSHNARRKFELALWNGDKKTVSRFIKEYQQKAAQLERDAKQNNLYK